MTAFTTEIDRADAFVVVTPEYNRTFPASLKQAIDFAYDEWQAKPVAFVSYGCRCAWWGRAPPAGPGPLAIETSGLVKVFGTTRAVDGVDLAWPHGQ
jgi:hypothetical protein